MMHRLHARFDRHGVDEWAAKPPAGTAPEAACHMMSELTPSGYSLVFTRVKRAARKRTCALTDLGCGLGRAVAHAVASNAFVRARGYESVPLRALAAQSALTDLRLDGRACVTEGNFCEHQVTTACALSFDVAFDRLTLAALAARLETSPALRAFVSFKPPRRWREAGMRSFELKETGRVQSSGEERFTYYIYAKEPGHSV